MKFVVASVALFAAAAVAQSGFTINTPSSVVECEPTLLSWSGGQAPYYLSVLPGATPNGTPIESFPETNSTSFTWTVNIQANTYIGFTLRDGAGAIAQSAAVTVTAGTSSSCLNSTSVVPGPTGASTSAAAGTTAGATTGATSAAASSAGTTPSSSASATSSKSSNGASANVAQVGAAGIVGAAVAALFL